MASKPRGYARSRDKSKILHVHHLNVYSQQNWQDADLR